MHFIHLIDTYNKAYKDYQEGHYDSALKLFQSIVDEIDNSGIESEKYGDMNLYNDSSRYINEIEYLLTEGYETEKSKNSSLEMPLLSINFFGILLCRFGLHRYDSSTARKYDVYVCNCCNYQKNK